MAKTFHDSLVVRSSISSIAALAALALALGCGGGLADGGGGDGGGGVGFGGAQDIGQFRALLAAGEIPGPNTLDANGFFSEHRTELPPPDCGETLCASGMLSIGRDWIADDYQATLQVALGTPIDPNTLDRPPLNMVVVVDTSGSMASENRIGFVRDGLHLLVDELEAGDRLALVTYSDTASLRLSLDTAAEPSELHALVDTLGAVGSTNIYRGLEVGLGEAASHFDVERQNRVILLSDGLATSGITSDQSILAMADQFIEGGVGLTTIGVGLDFNVELMRGLSERGAGNFYFVESAAAVTEVFTEELDYFVTPIGLGVSIKVATAPGYDLGAVTGTRTWKTNGGSGEMFLPAVFVASRVDDENPSGRRGGGSALFLDIIPRAGVAGPGPVATVTLSYALPGSGERIEQSITVESSLDPGELGDELYTSYAAMAEHYAVYNTYLGLRAAALHADGFNYNCAAGTLQTVRVKAIDWNAEFQDSDIAADIELIDQFIANLAAAGASPEAAGSCAVPGDPWDDDDYDDYGNDVLYGCSSTGQPAGSAGLLCLALLALGAARRRQRG